MAHGNEITGKRYYWLKLDRHFFKNGRVKKLRKLAGGDTYAIIYLEMLLLSIEQNGLLIFEGIEDTFAKEIALKLDEGEEDTAVTINYLLQQGLLVEQQGDFAFPDIGGMIGSETKSNIYKRQQRLSEVGKIPTKFQPSSNQIPTDKEKEIDIYNQLSTPVENLIIESNAHTRESYIPTCSQRQLLVKQWKLLNVAFYERAVKDIPEKHALFAEYCDIVQEWWSAEDFNDFMRLDEEKFIGIFNNLLRKFPSKPKEEKAAYAWASIRDYAKQKKG